MNKFSVIAEMPVGKKNCGLPGPSAKPFSGNYMASEQENAKDSSSNDLCFHTAA